MIRAYTSDGLSPAAYLTNGAAIAYNPNRTTYVNSVVSSGRLSRSSADMLLQGLVTFLQVVGESHAFDPDSVVPQSTIEQKISSLGIDLVTKVDILDTITIPELINLLSDDILSIMDVIDGGGVTGALNSSGNPISTPVNLETAITLTYNNKVDIVNTPGGTVSTSAQLSSIAYSPLSVVSDVFTKRAHTMTDAFFTDNPSNRQSTTTRYVVGGVMPGNDGNDVSATAAKLIRPSGLAIADNLLYISDKADNTIRAVSLTSGRIVKIAGSEQKGTSDSQQISANLTFPSDELLIFREEQGESGNPNTGKAGVIRGLNNADTTSEITEGSTNYRFGSIPTYRVSRYLDGTGQENVPALKTKIKFNELSSNLLFLNDRERGPARIIQGGETTDFSDGYKLWPAAIAANKDGTILFCEPDGGRIREIPRNAMY